MKIALDATYSLGEELSGVGVYSRELMHGLAGAYPEARFILCYRPHRYLQSFRAPQPPNCRRALLHEPWGPRSADLFHGLNQRLPRLKLPRTISTFHDLFVLSGDYATPDFRRRFAEQARHAAESDAIIAVSAFTASQVEQLLGVERARIHVVHHGIRRLPQSSCGREKLVLHVGAIQRRKNIGPLIAAFEALDPPWRLELAGGFGYGAAEILRRIEDSPSRNRIGALGYISAQALADCYARAAIFAFPSLDEGFGMPIIEAMARGVPVLTSNRAALPEIAGGAALLVNPADTEDIAAGLQLLATREDVRDDLRERGIRRSQDFSWELAVRQTWQVYQNVLNSSRRRP